MSPALAGGFLTTVPPGKSKAFLKKLIYLFIFGCIGSSLLRVRFSLIVESGGLLFTVVHGLLIAVASLVAEHGL